MYSYNILCMIYIDVHGIWNMNNIIIIKILKINLFYCKVYNWLIKNFT